LAPDISDQARSEGRALSGVQSALSQDRRDLPVGVLVEQLVDLGYHLGRGLPRLPGPERRGGGQWCGAAATEADLQGDLVGSLDQGHIFYE
jgi:hypothetical protein